MIRFVAWFIDRARGVNVEALRSELVSTRHAVGVLRREKARLEEDLLIARAVRRQHIGSRADYRKHFLMVPGVLDVALVARASRVDAYVVVSDPDIDRDMLEVLARNFTPVPVFVVCHVIEHSEHVG